MTTYYSKNAQGYIDQSTSSEEIARDLGLTFATNEEIVYVDLIEGGQTRMLQSEAEEYKQNPEYIEKKAKEERDRLDLLCLTKADFFKAIFIAKQVTKDQIRTAIETLPQLTDAERYIALIE